MKTNKYIRNSWASVLFMLLLWMPINGIAKTDTFELVVVKADGTELTFTIAEGYPVLSYMYGGESGINSIYIESKKGTESLPCQEIKRLYSRVQRGDANNDGNVNEKDISAIANYIITGSTKGFNFDNADLNYDGKVNAADIVKLVNQLKSAQ